MDLGGGKARQRGRLGKCAYVACQLTHVVVALGLLAAAIGEFAAASPYFDVLGPSSGVPGEDLFKNVSGQPLISGSTRVMDLPILCLLVFYFGVVVWFRGRGVWAWSVTASVLLVLSTFLSINLWAGELIDWRFFSDRCLGIFLNVVAISFSYSLNMLAVLNARNWFPFKLQSKRAPVKRLVPRLLLVTWNLLVLMTILTLCLLVWFSRLYTSWACVRSVEEVLLLCQFTASVQCWPCQNAESCAGVDQCVTDTQNAYHCMSPLHAANSGVKSAFCVFNYNIGVFTFITVFSYVGGLYFFTRTIVNALVKFLRVATFLALKGVQKICQPNGCSNSSLLVLPTTSYNSSCTSEEEEEEELRLADDQHVPSDSCLLHYSTSDHTH